MLLATILFSFLTIVSGQESQLPKTDRVYKTIAIEELVNRKSNTDVLEKFFVLGEIECGRRCVHKDDCLSFFYNKYNRMCQLHGRKLNVTADESTEDEGSHYYQVERRRFVGETCTESAECIMNHSICSESEICSCEAGYYLLHPTQKICLSGLIGSNCSLTGHCIVDHSECRADGTCGCEAGYSFQRSTHTCEDCCVEYGITFQHFPQRVLLLYDIFVKYAITVLECQQLCINATTYNCVSLDFYTPAGDCYHQQVDPTDVPLGTYVLDVSWTFYQRNCA